jgi:hypothetical protein
MKSGWRKIVIDDDRRNPRLVLWRHGAHGMIFSRDKRTGAPLLFPAGHLSDGDVVHLIEDLPEE